MRMWMVNPKIMCRKHLLGEHVETHMIAAHIKLGRRIDGWADTNCLQPGAIGKRHGELAAEMLKRGYKHASPLTQPQVAVHQRPLATVDKLAAKAELVRRCAECAGRAA